MDVGDVLRRARERAGLTQGALAERAGSSRATLCRYEKGAQSPTVRQLDRLLEACGLRLAVRLEPVTQDVDDLLHASRGCRPPGRDDLEPTLRTGARLAEKAGVAWAVDGRAALALQGLPLESDGDPALVVEETPALLTLLDLTGMQNRVSRQHLWSGGWTGMTPDQRVEALLSGPLLGLLGVVRLRLSDGPPESVQVEVDGLQVPVVPVHELVRHHPLLARALERARQTGVLTDVSGGG